VLVLLSVSVPLLLSIGGCSDGSSRQDGASRQDTPSRQQVVLADLCFAKTPTTPCADFPAGWMSPAHRLAGGWARRGPEGTWTLGEEATLELFLLGTGLQLTLRCTTARELARQGQMVTLMLNGVAVDSLALTTGWSAQELLVELPNDLVRQGTNTFTLRASRHGLQNTGGDEAINVAALRITGRLDARQRQRFSAYFGRHLADSEYAAEPVTGSAPAADPQFAAERFDRRQRPDLLLIVLDAARPDHLGCYGYTRPTTPFIDSLAAAGIVFEDVTAAAPYTLCSTTSLLTGRSWLEHGVERAGDALGDSLPTLAAILAGGGYHTVAFSENPQVSPATGLQRGFDRFYLTWVRGARQTTTEQIVSAIPSLPAHQPAFLFVHFLPPHEPYDPTPAHDLFTDPDYRGPANGGSEYLRGIDTGKLDYTNEDLRQLIGLYDGNLHMADAWTQRLVSAWRTARSTRDLITVIVSDHGEAFAEHGRFGHNSTLYREMLQVPLVIHPRHLCEPLAAAAPSFRTLADVMPMLLGVLEIPLPAGSRWPRHFLRLYTGDTTDRQQVLLRPSHEGYLGLRTADHLAIHGGLDRQELYALGHDPQNLHNVRHAEPTLFARLAGGMRRLLADRATIQAPTDQAQFSEQDRARLESLGY